LPETNTLRLQTHPMKRVLLTAVILLGATFAAHADQNVWTNLLKTPRGDYAVKQDAAYCADRVGPDLERQPMSPAFKRCMRGRGWSLDHIRVTPHQPSVSWDDPTFQTCPFIAGC